MFVWRLDKQIMLAQDAFMAEVVVILVNRILLPLSLACYTCITYRNMFTPPVMHWPNIPESLSAPLFVERTLCHGMCTVLVRAPCALKPQ